MCPAPNPAIDPRLLEVLACPVDGSRLGLADAESLQRLNGAIPLGEVKNQLGRVVMTQLDAALVSQSGARLYPVVDEIPVLLVEEAIPLPGKTDASAAACQAPWPPPGRFPATDADDLGLGPRRIRVDPGTPLTTSEVTVSRTVQDHYDAHHFDCLSDAVLQHVRQSSLLGEVERYFDPRPWQCLIDVGCGASCRNAFFAQRYWGRQTIAVDVSRRTLEEARQRIAVPLVNASVLALPFRDQIADFITCTGVIHHTPNPRRAFHELARVLRPDGGLFLSVYNRGSIYHPVYKYVGCLFRTLVRWRIGPLIRGVVVPMYAAAYAPMVWLALGRISHVPYAQAAADFDDKFLSPLAHFYRPREIEDWIDDEEMTCLASGTHMAGMMLGFLIKKRPPWAAANASRSVASRRGSSIRSLAPPP